MTRNLTTTQRSANVATIALLRPEARNALSQRLIEAVLEDLNQLLQDPAIRCLIICGNEGHFCAGADLKERLSMSAAERWQHSLAIKELCDEVAEFPVPVIAAIDGYALAGGAELALACDLRICTDRAAFGFPEVKIGIFPGAGGVSRLPAVVGEGYARDLLMTGRTFLAAEAFRIGFVTRVVPPAILMEEVMAIAEQIVGNAPLAVRALKRAMGTDSPDEVVAERESLESIDDYPEGLAAFEARRMPEFSGR